MTARYISQHVNRTIYHNMCLCSGYHIVNGLFLLGCYTDLLVSVVFDATVVLMQPAGSLTLASQLSDEFINVNVLVLCLTKRITYE